jgi:hypothetical protein
MTTQAQIKRALKPLLERNPDLALVGSWVIVKPVHHVVRGISIDRTGQADVFNPEWAVMPLCLCEIRSSIFLSWGSSWMPPRMHHPDKGLWKWSRPGVVEALENLIESVVLPKIRAVVTLDDLVQLLVERSLHRDLDGTNPLGGPDSKALSVQIARGELDAASAICVNWVSRFSEATYGQDDNDRAKFRRMKELCRLLAADDRAGMAKLLHEWEAQTVRNLKIEHLWEPTPFPLELMG